VSDPIEEGLAGGSAAEIRTTGIEELSAHR
jgi:hypothetical protein